MMQMTKEEKQLLFKDLCARLPYGVNLGFENSNVILIPKDYCHFTQQLFSTLVFPEHNGTVEYGCQLYEYRPYLRPMSSMTEEEADEWAKASNMKFDMEDGFFDCYDAHLSVDWLNEHHFDYRGLIEKGLALEAPEGLYE